MNESNQTDPLDGQDIPPAGLDATSLALWWLNRAVLLGQTTPLHSLTSEEKRRHLRELAKVEKLVRQLKKLHAAPVDPNHN